MSVRAGYLVPTPSPRMPIDQGETLVRNGPAILIEKFERLRDEKTLYGAKTIPFLMDFKSSIDIDDGDDFWLAEAIFEKNKKLIVLGVRAPYLVNYWIELLENDFLPKKCFLGSTIKN